MRQRSVKATSGGHSLTADQGTATERLKLERDEALAQLSAVSEVLRVISSSPGILNPVFEAILENATRICQAKFGAVYRYEDGLFHTEASLGEPPALLEFRKQRGAFAAVPGQPLDRLIKTRAVVRTADDTLEPVLSPAAKLGGARSHIAVPMFKDDELVGAITIYRKEVRPFTNKQIELVQNFATQAVIAIENARLFHELRQRTDDLSESLEQQTATSEILKVISSSPGNLQPTFTAMLENAARICEAKFGILLLAEGDAYRVTAIGGAPPASYVEERRRNPVIRPRVGTCLERALTIRSAVQVANIQIEADGEAASGSTGAQLAQLAGARTVVSVPMVQDDKLVGAILIFRQEVRPFTDKQIALVQNFAAQAVIAIENARLLKELRELLEGQTATSNILRVIASSPGDVEGSLGKIAETTARLFGAVGASFRIAEGDALKLSVGVGQGAEQISSSLYADPAVRPTVGGRNLPGTVMRESRQIHLPDLDHLDDEFADWPGPPVARRAGIRTMVGTPLRTKSGAIGALIVYRNVLQPFEAAELELLQSFADQAVIAIENARLLNELRQRTNDLSELLEQQTATSEVLHVISSSPGELEPVFQAMLENAVRICGAKFGQLYRFEGGAFHLAAGIDIPPDYAQFLKKRGPFLPPAGSQLDRAMRTKRASYTADMAADATPGSPARLGGARSAIAVPMLKDNDLVGAIIIYRQEVRPFTDKQVELVENFAAQAVIAIENTRLLHELRESLQQQTATAEVLRVISSSPGELQPVFSAMLENATRLCEANFGAMGLWEGYAFRVTAMHNPPRAFADARRREPLVHPSPLSPPARVTASKQLLHIADLSEDIAYLQRDPVIVGFVELAGVRTLLVVPMLKETEVMGVIAIYRQEVRPFTYKQIELVQNFAAQAVIAIENARLLNELRQRTDDLSLSLEELRAAQDRLVQTQKLASLGQLTAGIAHEIKNPLNFVNNFSGLSVELIEELQEALEGANLDDKRRGEVAEITTTLRENLDKIAQHGKRANSIVKNMLLHSREGSGERRSVDVNALVEESLSLAYHGARAEKQGFNIALERSFDPAAGEVDAYPQEITRVLLNLISNGFYAATKRQGQEDGNGFEPTITAATKGLGDTVEIKIRDNGIGIPPEVREKMFNPFFTTKPAGEGTGLGLSISYDIIVKQHSGSMEVDTEPGQFTEFRIILPRTTA